jgi:hypothetical protein
MNKSELDKILKDHADYLAGNGGRKANLRGANLRGADFQYADIRYTNLQYANLRGADLRDADLQYANLRGADLRDADLRDANLRGADFRYADLRDADLLTFQYQKNQAYCTGERLIIGCEDKSLAEWADCYEEIGKNNGYTELQIAMYGKFIEMCVEHNGLIGDKDEN